MEAIVSVCKKDTGWWTYDTQKPVPPNFFEHSKRAGQDWGTPKDTHFLKNFESKEFKVFLDYGCFLDGPLCICDNHVCSKNTTPSSPRRFRRF